MEVEKKWVIANWKMKLGPNEARELAMTVKKIKSHNTRIAVCPSFLNLAETAKILKTSEIMIGSQDCFWENDGAFTGEISPKHLHSLGCDLVILGHSERRKYNLETDEMVHLKTKAALDAGLIPVICVGETFDQRAEGAKDYTLITQTRKALEGISLDSAQQIIVAYEPVWVIGTGQAIDPEEANDAHQVIRQTLYDIFSIEMVKSNFNIIYGGSVDGENVRGFTEQEAIDGVLVGSASLRYQTFDSIVKNV